MMIEKCCSFTGHRPKKFLWGYNEADERCVALKQALAEQISRLVDKEYTDFLSGMAEGTDAWAAMAVLALKKDIPTLKLHCILPCEGQADGWSASARELYNSILEQADEVVYGSQNQCPYSVQNSQAAEKRLWESGSLGVYFDQPDAQRYAPGAAQ